MARSLLWVVTGVFAGAVSVWLIARLEPVSMTRSSAPAERFELAELPVPAPLSAPRDGSFAAERIAILEQAAATDSLVDLEQWIRLAASEPPSRLRELRLEALLARLAEIDPAHAVQTARANYLGLPFLFPLYDAWARSDPEGVLYELGLISPPSSQRAIALAVLEALGGDADALARVAAVLPESSRFAFEVDVLVGQAEADPLAALVDLARSPREPLNSIALERIAELAAARDPQMAFAALERIEFYQMRMGLQGVIFAAWADLDPDSAFAWIETAEIAALPESPVAYQRLAEIDSARVLALLDRLPPALRVNVERVAIQTLAEQDAIAALAMLDAMPPSPGRENLLQTIAQTYGRQNPDLALAWLQGLPPAQAQAARGNVLLGIAGVDPERAVELVIAELQQQGAGPTGGMPVSAAAYLAVLSQVTDSGMADTARIADRLLDIDNPTLRSMMSVLMSSWVRSDPDGALGFALANTSRLDPSVFSQIALATTERNAEQAIAVVDRLPPAQQVQWVSGVAQSLADSDVDRALAFIDRFGAEPGFEQIYGTVARQLARTDPATAAGLIERSLVAAAPGPGGATTPAPVAIMSTAGQIAREWATRDAGAAADWAFRLGDERVRTQAVSQAMSTWAARDFDAATQWAMGVASGTRRDSALDGLMSGAAQAGRFEPRLMDAYSNPNGGQTGASRAIVEIGRNDPQEARRLLDAYITDPAVRRQTEAQLARTAGSGSNPALSLGGLIF